MTYMLDTNACISYLNRADSPVRTRLQRLGPESVALCSVVEAELHYGVLRSSRPEENLARLGLFLRPFVSYPFDSESARAYGETRSRLARVGTPIGPNDLMIAAIALVHGAVLVTHNTREFSRIESLQTEDWEA